MTQTISIDPVSLARRPAAQPTVWGLTARRLHDAYWHARGVHCVHRGEPQALQGAAELFLLVEPRQLVLFDLKSLMGRLVWRKAAVTRLRVVEHDAETYAERVVTDCRGFVERIERRYRPRTASCYRVMLTTNRRIARIWMAASNRRDGWAAVRRSVGWSHMDHARCPGGCFTHGQSDEEHAFISGLVSWWSKPAESIDGIEEVGEGVWAMSGETVPDGAVLIPPLWVGRRGAADADACVMGPGWVVDRLAPDASGGARIRAMSDVEVSDDAAAQPPPSTLGYGFFKRTFDVAVSLVALFLGLPLFVAVALCILIDDGRPVFYGHVRQSRGGRRFRCWKFRTMCRNADTRTAEFAGLNLCDGPQVFIRSDPRVTRVGQFLRRFEIDEFPQFWNVLRGDMSIVGPRPSPDGENQYCPAWREIRLSVRPGITGLWQLKRTRAPGEDFQEWIKYDVEYVRRASFWFDLAICARTAWVLLTGRRG